MFNGLHLIGDLFQTQKLDPHHECLYMYIHVQFADYERKLKEALQRPNYSVQLFVCKC